jgi:large subunit ribosomal protein L22
MNVTAHSKNVRISTRKVRLVADSIRKLSVEEALTALQLSDKRAAGPLETALKSAIANAVANANLARENLVISSIIVNEGQALKRFRPSTRGRVHPYKRRASHITISLAEKAAPKVMKKAVAKEETKTTETKGATIVQEKKGVKGA